MAGLGGNMSGNMSVQQFPPGYLTEYRGRELFETPISLLSTNTLLVSLRLIARRFHQRKFEADDGLILAAYLLNVGMCALAMAMTTFGGAGRHVVAVDLPTQATWAKSLYAFELMYFLATPLPRLSMLLLYLRVFNWRGPERAFMIGIVVVLVMSQIAYFFTAMFQCTPIAYWWLRQSTNGYCINHQTFFRTTPLPMICLDVLTMALPMPTIWKLQLPLSKKFALAGMFFSGVLGILASIIRAYLFYNRDSFKDFTWGSVDVIKWSITELGANIDTACLPHLRPLISYYTPAVVKKWVRGIFARVSTAATTATRARTAMQRRKSMAATRGNATANIGLTTVTITAGEALDNSEQSTATYVGSELPSPIFEADEADVADEKLVGPLRGGILVTELITVTTETQEV